MNNYQASKQADALMLLYLLSSDELIGLLARQLPLRPHKSQAPWITILPAPRMDLP